MKLFRKIRQKYCKHSWYYISQFKRFCKKCKLKQVFYCYKDGNLLNKWINNDD